MFLNVEDFKRYIRVEENHEYETLSALLAAAEGYIADPENGVLGRPVEPTAFVEEFPDFGSIELKHPDHVSAVTITHVSEEGQETEVAGGGYRMVDGRAVLQPGETWPPAPAYVRVSYTAGPATVPEPVKRAAYFYAASLYAHREATEGVPKALRDTISLMLSGYRRPKL